MRTPLVRISLPSLALFTPLVRAAKAQTLEGDLELGALGDGGTSKGESAHGVDLSRHFQWHAREGGGGAERWTLGGADFRRDLDELADVLTPQHEYRLDATALEGRRFGELACREYRESVLHSLPHSCAPGGRGLRRRRACV